MAIKTKQKRLRLRSTGFVLDRCRLTKLLGCNLQIGEIAFGPRTDPQGDASCIRLELQIIDDETGLLRAIHVEPRLCVEAVLEEMARNSGKGVNYEMPTREAFANFMTAISDKAQSQYIEWLLDFLDDYKKGLNDDEETFSWIVGKPAARSLERMRTKMPELYQIMQPRRNEWWAQKINEVLATQGTTFVAVGQLHVMGSDGIPGQLERLGVSVRQVLPEDLRR